MPRFTTRELRALAEACNFRLACDTQDLDDAQIDALTKAWMKIDAFCTKPAKESEST